MKRLQQFFEYHEVVREPITITTNDKNPGLTIRKACVKWTNDQPENTLIDIDLDAHEKELIAIVGPVGSGKTTLFNVILKELPLTNGSMQINGSISYASQEPWLFIGSIRQNIIFGEKFDLSKYFEVIKVCALERDFALLPFGDKTIAGERGVTLSGGQKARINLARAVYKEADIYLLDDPLSAVDAQVGRQIFQECIKGYLKNKVVVLITHQLQYLHDVERIYLLENGRMQASGTYEELSLVTKLLHEHENEDDKEHLKEETTEKEPAKDKKQNEEGPKQEKEHKGVGNIPWAVYKSYIFAGGHWCKILALLFGFVVSQTAASLTDYFQSFW